MGLIRAQAETVTIAFRGHRIGAYNPQNGLPYGAFIKVA